jgi:hypothetical protein
LVSQFSVEKVKGYLSDFREFAKDCLKVRDHQTAQILPFELNPAQVILHEVTEKQRREMGFVRIVLDKARRFGGSTYVEGRFYWRTGMDWNRNTFIVGHEDDSTDTLFAMAKLFHERNPIKPKTRYSSKKELVFDDDKGTGLKSEYSLACAKNTDAGRSQGIHYFHGSEVAFWRDADTLLDGLLACIPPLPMETEVFLESTGNGFGNRFQRDVYDIYAEGKYPYFEKDGVVYAWKRPGNDWVLVFIPWFVHPQYSKKFDSKVEKDGFVAEINKKVLNKELMVWEESEDLKLQQKYNLSLEQLHWRRWKIENDYKGRSEKFRVEYPCTIQESFLSTGSNVYPATLCDILEANCKEPVLVGDVVDRMGKTQIRPNPMGHFRIWEKPIPRETYFMTVDSAGGKKESQKKERREPDPTCIDVWNRNTGTQVAQWHGHIEYDLIADIADMIGKYYLNAIACVELQNHGYTVVANLKEKRYPMFCAKEGEPGWHTSSKTKPQMVDGLYQQSRDGSLVIRSKETINEMRTFIEENGKYNAESGCHDERVDCGGMASQMMILLPAGSSRSQKDRDEVSIGSFMKDFKPTYSGEFQQFYAE